MKKVFAICAIAVAMVACNNEASTVDAEKAAADSARVADSLKAAEAMKAAPMPDSMSAPMVDSASMKPMADTTKK
jgi:hypothetical protein